jgi:hypothetical protein
MILLYSNHSRIFFKIEIINQNPKTNTLCYKNGASEQQCFAHSDSTIHDDDGDVDIKFICLGWSKLGNNDNTSTST